jgi:TonB family protein
MAATAAIAQDTTTAPEPPTPSAAKPQVPVAEQLKSWDQSIEMLRQGLWRVQSEPSAQIKDSRGRTMADDLNDHILTPAVTAELEKLREEAHAKEGDEAAAREVIARVQPVVREQLTSLGIITFYWGYWMAVNHHQKILEPWLVNASPADRESVRVHIAGVEKELAEQLNAGFNLKLDMTLDSPPAEFLALMGRLRDTTSAATRFYNERRLALVQQQTGGKPAGEPKSRTRQSACPAPVAITEARDNPGLAPDNVALEEVYPPIAKRMSVEGPVVLRVKISETGCMEQADLVGTSGSEDLDDAALLWAENAKYIPAAKGGQGVAGSFSFRVKFELK